MIETTVEESSASVKAPRNAHKQRKQHNGRGERNTEVMTSRAKLRWDGEAQTETELRQFFEDAPVDRVFAVYDKMRKHFEIAGEILNRRAHEKDQEKCDNCGVVFTKDIRWFHRDPIKDVATGIIRNVFSCSQACFIENKKKTQTGFRKF